MRKPLPLLIVLAFTLLFGGACATLKPPQVALRFWPPPPDPPRIQYTEHITGSRWIQRQKQSFLRKERLGTVLNALDLIKPYDVLVDVNGRIIISDTGRTGLMFLDPKTETFGQIAHQGARAIAKPLAIDQDADGNIYAIDGLQLWVTVLDAQGEFLRNIGGDGQLIHPGGIAIDSERDRVYVVDVKAHDVKVFNREGELLQTIGKRGMGEGEFNFPSFAAVGPQGRLHVVDTMNTRIQRFDPEGNFVDAWGEAGNRAGYFSRIKGIDVDAEGRIWVVDAAFGMVQIFDADWRLLLVFSEFGAGDGALNLPAGISVTPTGDIYVASQMSHSVEVYHLMTDAERDARADAEEDPPAEATP